MTFIAKKKKKQKKQKKNSQTIEETNKTQFKHSDMLFQ